MVAQSKIAPTMVPASLWRGRVALIAKPGGPNTGVGRYVQMLHAGLHEVGVDAVRVVPTVPPLSTFGYSMLRRLGVDLHAFLVNYPIWASYPEADIYHLTSQNLASLLLFRRPKGRIVVTVHDIIPYMLRNDAQLRSYHTIADRLFDRMAMAGLKRADYLIADSYYTKQSIVHHLGIAPDKIDVIYLGIDHEHFKPLPVSPSLYERYGLQPQRRYVIYVGSEDPRKNLATLMRALGKLRTRIPDLALIKVGRAHFNVERQRLVELVQQLGLAEAVHFLDDVPEADLPLLYNLADVCVMPSLYEGFGFPVLEAMACGTPVICTRAASLPELVGEAGVVVEPGVDAVNNLADGLANLLMDRDAFEKLPVDSRRRAATFTWVETVAQMLDTYRSLAHPQAKSGTVTKQL